MKRAPLVLFVLFLVIATAGPAVGQDISEKKEIAIFNLSYYDYQIPNGALGSIDAQIKDVFTNLGRFNVIGMTYRLDANDVNAFIDQVKQAKEANVELPEEVKLGREVFTEADFNRLVGSFVVVIPSVTYYNVDYEKGGGYDAEIETSFTFVNVDELSTLAQFSIETSGFDKDGQRDAVRDAVEAIPNQLQFEIRKIPLFQLRSGIIEVAGGSVIMELGHNMGVRVGDEYAILQTRSLSSGRQFTEESGLVVVKDVNHDFSEGTILYTEGRPQLGDQLREVPRLGFDATLYANVMQDVVSSTSIVGTSVESVLVAGLRTVATRGFYNFRPVVGVEVPIKSGIVNVGFPLGLYVGGELNWYLRRIQITPSLVGGLAGVVPFWDEEEFYLSHVGWKGQLSASLLINRDFKVFAEGGFGQWFSTSPFSSTYGGTYVGGGVVFKL